MCVFVLKGERWSELERERERERMLLKAERGSERECVCIKGRKRQ